MSSKARRRGGSTDTPALRRPRLGLAGTTAGTAKFLAVADAVLLLLATLLGGVLALAGGMIVRIREGVENLRVAAVLVSGELHRHSLALNSWRTAIVFATIEAQRPPGPRPQRSFEEREAEYKAEREKIKAVPAEWVLEKLGVEFPRCRTTAYQTYFPSVIQGLGATALDREWARLLNLQMTSWYSALRPGGFSYREWASIEKELEALRNVLEPYERWSTSTDLRRRAQWMWIHVRAGLRRCDPQRGRGDLMWMRQPPAAADSSADSEGAD